MANSMTVAQVYADICKLAYTETQMAIYPRLPFKIKSRERLLSQSGECADVAKVFRESGNPAEMDQAKVDTACLKLRAAQSMFDYINTQTSNSFQTEDVLSMADKAIQAVSACLTIN